MSERKLGMIGLGLLGSALAERFLKAGHDVLGFDVAPERCRALSELGGRAAGSAREVAQHRKRLVFSLPTTAVVEAVLAELEPELRPGTCILDTTTGDPERTAQLGAELHARGVGYVDATVAGSSEQVRQGEVVVMLGGDRGIATACSDLLACFAREWFYLGTWGSGARMKLVVNLVLGLNRAVLAEGLAFARACGLDLGETLQVLRAGPAYARAMDVKGPKMIERDFRPQARLAQHLKDVHLILAEAERVGACTPLSQLHHELLASVANAGYGADDNAAIIRAYDS